MRPPVTELRPHTPSHLGVTLRQLKVFLAVEQTRNFHRAGELLGLSQPAVSRSVRELERQLDLRLFHRSTREVVLTEAGQRLAQRLPRWIDELDNMLLELHHWANNRRGKVRVAAAPTLAAALMPACLAECARLEPDLEILLLDRIQQQVLTSVLAGEVDFGLVVEWDANLLRDLHGEVILQDPFVVVAPQDHELWQAGTPPSWQMLAGRPLILLDHASGSRRLIDRALADHQVTVQLVQQVGHATTGFEMVRAGLGISVMPGMAVPDTGLPGLWARPITPGVERNILLVHRHNRPPSPLAQVAWSLIASCAKRVSERRQSLWR